jgi:hypothetical protein
MRAVTALLGLGCLLCATGRTVADDKIPEGYVALFNGKDLTGWKVLGGKMDAWDAEDGLLFVKGKGGGWLLTEKEYSDFEIRLEFKLPEGGNSGVALRAPFRGNPAYDGMEIQILDDPWYKNEKHYKGIRPAQLTGSIYDVVPPSKDATKPAGEWNTMRIRAKGRHVTVELNGVKTVDANLDDHKDRQKTHPGLFVDKGHLGLQSHDGRVEFKHIYVKELNLAGSGASGAILVGREFSQRPSFLRHTDGKIAVGIADVAADEQLVFGSSEFESGAVCIVRGTGDETREQRAVAWPLRHGSRIHDRARLERPTKVRGIVSFVSGQQVVDRFFSIEQRFRLHPLDVGGHVPGLDFDRAVAGAVQAHQ